MAQHFTLTANLKELMGGVDLTRVQAAVTSNLQPGAVVVDSTTKRLHLGTGPVQIAPDGTVTMRVLQTNATDTNASGWRYWLEVTAPEHALGRKALRAEKPIYRIGPFAATADGNIADQADQFDTPAATPTWRDGVVEQVEGLTSLAAAEAARAEEAAANASAIALGDAEAALVTQLPNPATPIGGTLNAAIGGSLATDRRQAGNRVVFLGDSNMRGGITQTESALDDLRWRSPSIPTWASMLSKQRILEVKMAGIGGNTIAQMLARFDTDVAPHRPNVVVVMAGTNDTNSSNLTTMTDYADRMNTLLAKCVGIGARLVVCTIPPNNNVSGAPADRKTRVAKINAWLRQWAPAKGIQLIDINALLVNPADDTIKTEYNYDGTHLTEAGYYAAGAKIAAELAPTLPPNLPPLAVSNTDPTNLITNGLFLGTLASNKPTGWNVGVVAGVTYSLEASTDGSGNWYKMASAGHASTTEVYQTVSGIAGGRRYAFSGRLKADLTNGSLMVRLRFNTSSATGYEWRPASLLLSDVPDGAFYLECVAPSDATTAFIDIRFGAASSGGTVQVSQMTLVDLGALPSPTA